MRNRYDDSKTRKKGRDIKMFTVPLKTLLSEFPCQGVKKVIFPPIRSHEYFSAKMLKILDQGRKQEYIFTDGDKC